MSIFKNKIFLSILTIIIIPLLLMVINEIISLKIEYSIFNRDKDKINSREKEVSYNTSSEKISEEMKKINGSDISVPIQELMVINDVSILKAKLREYKYQGILAVGPKEAFEPPDGCYVFFVDKTNIRGPYQFNNSQFFDIRTKKNLNQLPDELLAMQQYWVIESYKLIQK